MTFIVVNAIFRSYVLLEQANRNYEFRESGRGVVGLDSQLHNSDEKV